MGGGETVFIYLGGKGRLMLDYLRLSPMIGGGSLSLKANGREHQQEKEEESMETKAKLSEITIDEMVREGYQVVLEEKEETAWEKTITITDKDNNSQQLKLYWDIQDGYSVLFDGVGLPDLAMRPEFEYVLDCLTEERP